MALSNVSDKRSINLFSIMRKFSDHAKQINQPKKFPEIIYHHLAGSISVSQMTRSENSDRRSGVCENWERGSVSRYLPKTEVAKRYSTDFPDAAALSNGKIRYWTKSLAVHAASRVSGCSGRARMHFCVRWWSGTTWILLPKKRTRDVLCEEGEDTWQGIGLRISNEEENLIKCEF